MICKQTQDLITAASETLLMVAVTRGIVEHQTDLDADERDEMLAVLDKAKAQAQYALDGATRLALAEAAA